jgi:hypothetical protein
MNLIQLIYSSVPTIPIGTREMIDILEPSQQRNRGDGITGLLAFSGQAFLQLLEGDEAKVSAAFRRIAGDPRHRDVHVLGRLPVAARAFADWDMGFAGFGSYNRALVERYCSDGTLACAELTAEAARSLLMELSGQAVLAPAAA